MDHQTGKIFQAPLSTNDKGEGHWVISGLFFFDKPPVQVRPNSRLFIIQREFYGKNGYDPDVYYFVWENEQFRLILHTIAGRVINPRS